ncbi:parallel beta-helix domain-containing protein [Pseudohongiella sp.]|uniref:Right handed beta helix domain-containing protein n=1 Tax=marine sediment metagenome TaxID=412755 RepID=A0A0F9VSE5_9ZZZZ|nr:parallel beta-helix domain-containing protein [Pseudohongiella sp.]
MHHSPSHSRMFIFTFFITLGGALAACSPDTVTTSDATVSSDGVVSDPSADLQLRFLEATPGDVINLPAGVFNFERSLTLNVDNITLRGAGMDATILSFRDQITGGEGLLVNASNFTIEDLAIEDSRGDALKIARGDNIVIRRVRTEWTNGPDTSNGAYGIYPVQTQHTLIEDSVAIAASDAGIYVGQSQNVIVRRNRAEYNVAGIEIENTIGADVYDNVAINNTGGILIFNMPNLPVEGHTTRVYNNRVHQNNTENFAPPGTAVASVPAGSGILINSNDKVEIFDNDLGHNQTANILISSYFSAGYSEREMAEAFDPYPETIFIYNNSFTDGGSAPGTPELDMLRQALFGADGSFPDIIWDGVTHPERTDMSYAICVDNAGAEILNIDAANNNANPHVDMGMHSCQHNKLAAVELPAGLMAE